MDVIEKKIKVPDHELKILLGPSDTNLQLIENKFDAEIICRGDTILLRGQEVELKNIETVLEELFYMIRKNQTLTEQDVTAVLNFIDQNKKEKTVSFEPDNVILSVRNSVIRARTPTQFEFYKKVKQSDVTFAIGPAGTGKTYLAVAMAVAALKDNAVTKIILSRPAVEAGESLGFLPGDLNEKVDPYLRPLLDALNEMITPEKLRVMIEKRVIEIVPLAYMRGRTLNNAFVILDEAQNSIAMQMKMFLTRLGRGSKMIITGDTTQIDLPSRATSGLVQIQKILKNIDGISFVYFDKADVVRHPLVAKIIDAYEIFTAKTEEQSNLAKQTNSSSQ